MIEKESIETRIFPSSPAMRFEQERRALPSSSRRGQHSLGPWLTSPGKFLEHTGTRWEKAVSGELRGAEVLCRKW